MREIMHVIVGGYVVVIEFFDGAGQGKSVREQDVDVFVVIIESRVTGAGCRAVVVLDDAVGRCRADRCVGGGGKRDSKLFVLFFGAVRSDRDRNPRARLARREIHGHIGRERAAVEIRRFSSGSTAAHAIDRVFHAGSPRGISAPSDGKREARGRSAGSFRLVSTGDGDAQRRRGSGCVVVLDGADCRGVADLRRTTGRRQRHGEAFVRFVRRVAGDVDGNRLRRDARSKRQGSAGKASAEVRGVGRGRAAAGYGVVNRGRAGRRAQARDGERERRGAGVAFGLHGVRGCDAQRIVHGIDDRAGNRVASEAGVFRVAGGRADGRVAHAGAVHAQIILSGGQSRRNAGG